MTAKKKSTKPAGPSPLLKLKFEKFPDKQIPVYFDSAKRSFRATFGFSQYEALSVGQLEGKIKAAIKMGATPDVVWVPVIEVVNEEFFHGGNADDIGADCSFGAERKYIAISQRGLIEVGWNVQEKSRLAKSTEAWGVRDRQKLKKIPKLPLLDGRDYTSYLPYTLEAWEKLRAIFGQLDATRKSLFDGIKRGDLSRVFTPKAASSPAHDREKATPAKPQTATKPKPDKAIAPKPQTAAKSKADNRVLHSVTYRGEKILLPSGPLPVRIQDYLRRTYTELNNAHLLKDGRVQLVHGLGGNCTYISVDQLQEDIELAAEPKPAEPKPRAHNFSGTPGPELRSAALSGALTQIQKLKPGTIPSLLLLAAGFPEGATGELYKDGYVIVNTAAEPTQEFSKANLVKKIRDRIAVIDLQEIDKNRQPSLLQEAGD